ncbi:BrnA antitoxin family protein [uncultured Devosia sp.]|uniref:BrnA antitoxin family protein n=1 Tax=uncultured Devosia sp. TaxID=211434 RepID=UPI0035CB7CE5
MNKREVIKEFVPGQGYTQEDWDEVSDNPELTEEELAQMRPFAEVFPELAESIRRGPGRPALNRPKQQVTLRLDAEVLTRLRASGPGWQARVNAVLKKELGL